MIRRSGKGKKGIALFEIFIMITATIAFAFIMNSAFASAVDPEGVAQRDEIPTKGASGSSQVLASTASAGTPIIQIINSGTGGVVKSKTAAEKLLETTGVGPVTAGTAPAGLTGAKWAVDPNTAQLGKISGNKLIFSDGSSAPYDAQVYTSKGGQVLTTDQLGTTSETTAQYNGLQLNNWGKTGLTDKLGGVDLKGATVEQLNSAGLKDVTQISRTDTTTTLISKDGSTVTYNTADSSFVSSGQTAHTNILGMDFYGGMSHLMTGLQWSLFVVGAIQLLGRLFGASDNLVNSLSIAAFAGIMTWKGIIAGIEQFGWAGGKTGLLWKSAGFVGIGVAALVFILLYKETEQKIVTYTCLPWEAPSGGNSCEKCNGDKFKPCSEYRCKALGQACQLLNPGTGNETCAWVSKFDVNSPTIRTDKEAIRPIGLAYIPDTGLRPGMTGVKVVNQSRTDGCLSAFTHLEFGFSNNEPAQCKLDIQHTTGIKDMQYYVGDTNLFSYNHTQSVKLPRSPLVNESGLPTLNNDGSYSMYVRCQDANGNENKDEFVFSYCVDKSPDTTPPTIEGTSISSGSYVRYAVDNARVDVYTNEPSGCRWSRIDEAYNDMKNNMSCNSQSYEVNANLQYTCSGNLTGIQNMEDNNFFFRCEDSQGNQNAQSYPFVLKGSQLLTVKSVAPNGTISGSTSTTTVTASIETSNGAEDGKATCYYYLTNSTGTVNNDNFLQMFSTDNYISKQDLDLIGGNYLVYFRCVDSGGNIASSNTTFSLFVDKSAPIVTRIYRELPDALKVITNEDAKCTYSLTTCNYNVNDGLAMIYANSGTKNIHLAQWKAGQTYYIKCSDFYGNEPSPDQCNIVAGAAQLTSAN